MNFKKPKAQVMLLQWLLSALGVLFIILIELVPTSLHGSLTASCTPTGTFQYLYRTAPFFPCTYLFSAWSVLPHLHLASSSSSAHVLLRHPLLPSSPPPHPSLCSDLFVFFTAVFLKLSCFHCLTLVVECRLY